MLGVLLETVAWPVAQRLMAEDLVVVVPVGAATKEHGPHLPLGTDFFVADALRRELAERVRVVCLPVVNYGYYPAFVDWPGSVSVGPETFARYVGDIVRSLAGQGWRRFLVLNTGVSTTGPLDFACRELVSELGVRVAMTRELGASTWMRLREEAAGTHAGESETSLMLAVCPHLVDRGLAPREIMAKPAPFQTGAGRPPLAALYGPMVPGPDGPPDLVTASGIHGDATLASEEKGRALLAAMVSDLLVVVRELKQLPLTN